MSKPERIESKIQLGSCNSESVPAINLQALDVLRGVLATYVVCGHARWLLWCGYGTWVSTGPHPFWQNVIASASAAVRYGHEAVIVFFVLSGFFIHLTASKRLAGSAIETFDLRGFFRRRARRLLPGYVVALVVTVTFDYAGRHLYPSLYLGQTGDPLLDIDFSRKAYDLRSVVPALLVFPGVLGHDFGSNGPLWSLAFEVVYYLLYPVWLYLRSMGAWLAYGVGLSFLTLAMLPESLTSVPVRIFTYYPLWIAGAGIAELSVRGKLPRIGWIGLSGPALLAFGALQHGILRSLSYILGGLLVVSSVALSRRVINGGVLRSGELLGLSSYSIYVCHFPVITILCAVAFRFNAARPSSGYYAFFGAAFAVFVGWLAFNAVETRYLSSRRKRRELPAQAT
jgi:peptidoglycan/LPS O-acetylase OafA/YrhL